MEQYTSEEALNGILNILTTVISEHESKTENKETEKNKTGNLITELLGGISAGSSKNVSLGSQIEELSNGMSKLKDSGINDSDAKNVASIISTLGDSIKKLDFTTASSDSVIAIANALVTFGSINQNIISNIRNISETLKGGSGENIINFIKTFSNIDKKTIENVYIASNAFISLGKIDEKTIENINNLSNINTRAISDFLNVISSIDLTKMSSLSKENIDKSVNQIGNLFNSINAIMNSNISTFHLLTSSMRAKLIANTISSFFNTIVKNIETTDVNIKIEGISSIISMFKDFADPNSKVSIYRILKIMNKDTGTKMSEFFKSFFADIPIYAAGSQSANVESVLNIMKFLEKIPLKRFNRMMTILNGDTGKSIGSFFKEIFDSLPHSEKVINSMTKLLKELNSIGISDLITLKIFNSIVNEKLGKSINGFITSLIKGIDENDMKEIDIFTKSVNTLSKGIIILTGSILLLAGGIAVLGISNIIMSMVAMTAFVGTILFIVKRIVKNDIDIKNGLEGLTNIAKVVTIMTADVLLLTIAANLMDFVEDAAFIKLAGIFILVGGILEVSIEVTEKWNANGEEILKMMAGVSLFLISASIAIAIAVSISSKNELIDVIIGIGMIAAVMEGMVLIMKSLDKLSGKNQDNALRAMIVLTGVLAVVSFLIDFVIIPIGREGENAFQGIVLVSIIMAEMIGIVSLLSILNTEKMKNANETLMIMTGMFAVISLVAAFILPNIANHKSDVLEGSAIVVGVIAVMSFIVGVLSHVIGKEDLKQADISLAVMTGMFTVISLVAAFILPMIADKIEQVKSGAIVVMVIIGVMAGVVWGLSNIEEKDLTQANMTLITMTGMFTVISLVAAFILPMIADKIEQVALGSAVVVGVIFVMSLIVLGLSHIEEKDLKQANITLAVMTGMFAVISLVAAFILPKIGENATNAMQGAIVVMAIIAAMAGVVWILSNIDEKNLKQANISLAVMTFVLLGVSLIAEELLIPIGKQFLPVLGGMIVVVGIIALMTFILYEAGEKMTPAKIRKGIETVGAAALILLGISLIVKELLIPIGQQWEEAALGGTVVVSVIGIMTAIVYAAGKIKKKQLEHGIIVVAASAALLGTTAYIIDNYLIPIGKESDDAISGGEVTLATIGIMTAIVFAAGKINKKDAIQGVAVVAAIEILIYGISKAFKPYIEVCKKIYKDIDSVSKGGAEIIATLTVWGGIILGIGELMKLGGSETKKLLAEGGIAVAGIGAVLWVVAKAMIPYIKVSKAMQKDAGAIAVGGAEIAATLTAWGVLMAGIGALMDTGIGAAVLASGAIAIAGIATVLLAISKILPSYIKLCINVSKSRNYITSGSKAIVDVLKGFGFLMAEIGAIAVIPLGAVAMAAGAAMLYGITKIITILTRSLDPFINLIKKMNLNKINSSTIGNFTRVFIGSGADDPNALVGSINSIMNSMSDIGIIASMKTSFISNNLLPMFQMLDMFVDIVAKMTNMKYADAWDKDGKPTHYKQLTMAMFSSAGSTISVAFSQFLIELSKGMDEFKSVSLEAIYKLSVGIWPIMKSVGEYTNTILSVISSHVAVAWDKDGHPTQYKRFDGNEFAKASKIIADNFSSFLTSLANNLKTVAPLAGIVMDSMKDSIVPIFDSVAKFTNTINSVAYGQTISYTENGKDVKKFIRFSPSTFKKAATTIGDAFSGFITGLYDSLKKAGLIYNEHKTKDYLVYKSETTETKSKVGMIIAGFKDINVIISAVSDLTDIFFKEAANKNFNRLGYIAYSVSNTFINFVETLVKGFTAKTMGNNIEIATDNIDSTESLINKFSKSYKKLQKMADDNKSSKLSLSKIDHMYDILIYFVQEDKLKTIRKINVKDISNVLPYMKEIVSIAKTMKKLDEAMSDADMTKSCIKFIKDIEILTQEGISSKVSNSRKALGIFGKDLGIFTSKVIITNKNVIKFSKSMSAATKSFKTLDSAILNREKQRNDALKKMSTLFNEIADSVEKLSKQIESLDKNKILNNFKGIAELLELAKKNAPNIAKETPVTAQNGHGAVTTHTSENNALHANTKAGIAGQHQQTGNNTYVSNMGNPGKMMISVQFQNTVLNGFVQTRQI